METKEIFGPWKKGYVLDQHMLSSEFVGYSSSGIAQYNSKRSELGELLYQGKYLNNKSSIKIIGDLCIDFLNSSKIYPDLILPIPPSKEREWNLVFEVSKYISQSIKCKYNNESINKIKETKEIKSIGDFETRENEIKGAFNMESKSVTGKRVLLVDDLYSSGSTMYEVATLVSSKGDAIDVFVLCFTYTKSKS